MTATICPTVTARSPEEYREQMNRIAPFATRIHIDIADGIFTPVKLTPIDEVWWPGGIRADIHVMYQQPFDHVQSYLSLGPQMVIVHAEADGAFQPFAELMHHHGIEVGVAIQQHTSVATIAPAIDSIDHVLIFSGNLGHFGGRADLGLVGKAKEILALNPRIEIGWDGGINADNAKPLAMSGVDVLNTGGFIQHAIDPRSAYTALTRQLI